MDAHHLITLKLNPKITPFRAGDNIRVNFRIREGTRSRIQAFDGLVIRSRGGGPAATFTVRQVSRGFGVERTFPLYSPHIDSVVVLRYGKVRRARLYYQRERFGRAARIKEGRPRPTKFPTAQIDQAVDEALQETAVDEAPQEVAVDEAPQEVAVDEAPQETAVDEAPQEVAVNEAPQETAVDEAPQEVAVNEAPQETLADNGEENSSANGIEPSKDPINS